MSATEKRQEELSSLLGRYMDRYESLTVHPSAEEKVMSKEDFEKLKDSVGIKLDIITMFYEFGYEVTDESKQPYHLIGNMIKSNLQEIKFELLDGHSRVSKMLERVLTKVGNDTAMRTAYEMSIEKYKEDLKIVDKLINLMNNQGGN